MVGTVREAGPYSIVSHIAINCDFCSYYSRRMLKMKEEVSLSFHEFLLIRRKKLL